MLQAELMYETKTCLACKKDLPLTAFYTNGKDKPHQRKSRCISCYLQQTAQYRDRPEFDASKYYKPQKYAKSQLTREKTMKKEEKPARQLAMRYNEGKTNYSLLPLHLLEGAVRVLQAGAEKYEEWNWARGMPWSTPYSCAVRHIAAWYRGETNDSETGENHLDHAICNLLMLKHFAESYKEGDDRPTLF